MARTTSITKRSLINRANSTIVVSTMAAAFIVVFALLASKSLLGQAAYQNRVIDAKKTALKRLENDLAARDKLNLSYDSFVKLNPNVIGGNPNGKAAQDVDNATLILDALPSRYDFPALTASLERLITSQNLKIVGISGTDEEATEGPKNTSPKPEPVPMPFQVEVSGSYQSIQDLVDVFLRSIRPFQIKSLELSGDPESMVARIQAQTYYQPEKNLNITSEVVK